MVYNPYAKLRPMKRHRQADDPPATSPGSNKSSRTANTDQGLGDATSQRNSRGFPPSSLQASNRTEETPESYEEPVRSVPMYNRNKLVSSTQALASTNQSAGTACFMARGGNGLSSSQTTKTPSNPYTSSRKYQPQMLPPATCGANYSGNAVPKESQPPKPVGKEDRTVPQYASADLSTSLLIPRQEVSQEQARIPLHTVDSGPPFAADRPCSQEPNGPPRIAAEERFSSYQGRPKDSTEPIHTTLQATKTTLARPPSWGHPASTATAATGEDDVQVSSSATRRPELPGEALLPMQLVFDPESIQPIKDEYRQKLVNNATLSKPMLNGWTLFPHQRRAVLKGLMKRRVILALDMGLGKTLIGCVWSRSFQRSFQSLKILVVCPVSLKGEWKRTAEEAAGIQVEEDKGAEPGSLDMKICSWAKVPTKVDSSVEHFVVVFDEAHSMQSMESARTKASLQLVEDDRCVGVLLLTGTPMKNGKASNLFPLLKAVHHPLGRHQKSYEKHFCDGKLANFGRGAQWVANGCSNLKQLKRLIAPNLLHLTKEECLAQLPPLARETRHVPISARSEGRYVQCVQELAKIREAALSSKEKNMDAVLGATQRLRVLSAFAKVEATVELAKSLLEEEPALVIFTQFAQVAKSVHQKLVDSEWAGELLTGETPSKKRQALVDNFQAGLSPVFVCTFGAGGVGITLTAASTIILLDRPWTPGEMRQAEDRIRRIGQTKKMRSIWMSAFELDSQVDAMLEAKNQATKAVLANGEDSGVSSTGIDVQRLLRSLISKVP